MSQPQQGPDPDNVKDTRHTARGVFSLAEYSPQPNPYLKEMRILLRFMRRKFTPSMMMTVGDVAQATGIAVADVPRLLIALEDEGELISGTRRLIIGAEAPRKPDRRKQAKTPDVRAHVWDKTYGKCWYCGVQTNPFSTFTVDHVIPICEGGTNDLENLVPACRVCNSVKGKRGLTWLRKRFVTLECFYFEVMGLESKNA